MAMGVCAFGDGQPAIAQCVIDRDRQRAHPLCLQHYARAIDVEARARSEARGLERRWRVTLHKDIKYEIRDAVVPAMGRARVWLIVEWLTQEGIDVQCCCYQLGGGEVWELTLPGKVAKKRKR